jgi:hypothetical protein
MAGDLCPAGKSVPMLVAQKGAQRQLLQPQYCLALLLVMQMQPRPFRKT